MVEFGKKVTFYRQSIVRICFQMVLSGNKEPAMNIDMASGSSWDNKTTLQLSIHECSSVVATLLKLKSNVFLGFHGQSNMLGFNLAPDENQQKMSEGIYFAALIEGGKPKHYIQLQEFECFGVFNLFVEQLSNHFQCSRQEVISLITTFYR